jgi:uncharacterized membrane protein YfcA
MRIGSGITVGFLGAALGLRPALAWSAAALCVCVAVLAIYLALATRRSTARDAATSDAVTDGNW